MNTHVEFLKGYILYSLLLPEWPLKDFGHFVDYFGTYSGQFQEDYQSYSDQFQEYYQGWYEIGMNNITYRTIAKSLFDIEDFDPGIRVWWLPTWERLNLTEDDISKLEQRHTHIYPLPAWLAKLVVPGNVTGEDFSALIAHPAFIEDLTAPQLIKLFKFGLWIKYKSNVEGANKTISDVLRDELKIFEDQGFKLRNNFQVRYDSLFQVFD